jgi:hypothetical protein
MKNSSRLTLLRLVSIQSILLALMSGCATFQPVPIDKISSAMERVQTKTQDGVAVSVSILNAKESEQLFGALLAKKGIQPVWLRIVNMNDYRYLLLANKIDRDYFSPHEASWKNHYYASEKANLEMDRYYFDQQMPLVIEP